MSVRGRLTKKEVPFLVTVLIGIAGWAITHGVSRTLSAPTLEYEVETTAGPAETLTKVTITNLSRELFSGLIFEIQGTSDASVCRGGLQPKPPAFPATKPPQAANNAVRFSVDQLQPGWQMAMCARFSGEVRPVFVMINSDRQAVQLLEPSLRTFLVRYEFAILSSLFVVAFIAFLTWLLATSEVREPQSHDRDW